MQSQAENENQAMNQMVQDHAAKVAELDQTIANFQAQFSSQQNVITQFQQEYQKLVDGKKSSEEECESLKSQLKSAEVNYLIFNTIQTKLTDWSSGEFPTAPSRVRETANSERRTGLPAALEPKSGEQRARADQSIVSAN
jgi:chromosome segregation ATPase